MEFLDRLAAVNWLAVLSAAVPALSLAWRFTRTPRSRSHLDDLIEVHDKLPVDAQKRMMPALESHLDQYLSEIDERAGRKIAWSSVAALVFVATVGGAALWGIGWLALNFHWLLWIVFGVVLIFTAGLLGTGMGQIYKKPGATAGTSRK